MHIGSRLSAALLALLLSAPIAAQADEQAPVPAPEAEVGDEWSYEVLDLWAGGRLDSRLHISVFGTYDTEVTLLVRTEGGTSGTGSSVKRTEDRKTQTLHVSFREGPFVQFDFPLSVGKTWQSSYRRPARGPGRTMVQVQHWAKAVGWETVTVPAGTFKALKIESAERAMVHVADGIFPAHTEQVYWYAPEVGRHVRLDTEVRDAFKRRISMTRQQLTSYTRK